MDISTLKARFYKTYYCTQTIRLIVLPSNPAVCPIPRIWEYEYTISTLPYLSVRIIQPFSQCLSLSTLLKHALQEGW